MRLIRVLIILLPGIFFVIIDIPVKAQISIAPTTLYIHDDNRIASLMIGNGHDMAREISVSFEFGYPSSDSLGNLVMVYNDTAAETLYGLGSKLRAFPRRFVLEPGSQQIVRVQVLPDNDKPDGAYWNRMIISSSKAIEDIDKNFISGAVSTSINYIFKQNIALFYLKGNVTTGLIAAEVKTCIDNGKLTTVSELRTEGNSPFNGSVNLCLSDNAGNVIARHSQTIVVYFDILKRIEMELPAGHLAPGSYDLEFVFRTERSDIPSSDLVQCDPVHFKMPLVIE
jgi:hypothetical protein